MLVTIIIPTFDRAELLKDALNSIKTQTYSDWETIVVDDGSSDSTKSMVVECAKGDPRIRFHQRDRLPKGAPACRNIGLAAARGDYVIFLDSDDLLAPTCLERRTKAIITNPAADFIVFQGTFFETQPDTLIGPWNVETGESDLARFLRGDSVWHTTGPVWKKAFVESLGGFDERLSCWQDVDIHSRALLQNPQYESQLNAAPDYFIRRHATATLSQQGLRTRENIDSMFLVYEKLIERVSDSAARNSLRNMLALIFQSAVDARLFDLTERVIQRGTRDGVLTAGRAFLWRSVTYAYKAHGKGFRGAAGFGKALMRTTSPRIRRL
jgi:glycosyltransferase involved in cell wall biosynthesis